jgi:hypothetical protein
MRSVVGIPGLKAGEDVKRDTAQAPAAQHMLPAGFFLRVAVYKTSNGQPGENPTVCMVRAGVFLGERNGT